LVRNTIRGFFNLNNSAHLNLYGGPVILIRRLREEIIITNDSQSIRTNRGNDLLIKLLQSRFPKLMADENVKSVLSEWLTTDISNRRNNIFNFLKIRALSWKINEHIFFIIFKLHF